MFFVIEYCSLGGGFNDTKYVHWLLGERLIFFGVATNYHLVACSPFVGGEKMVSLKSMIELPPKFSSLELGILTKYLNISGKIQVKQKQKKSIRGLESYLVMAPTKP